MRLTGLGWTTAPVDSYEVWGWDRTNQAAASTTPAFALAGAGERPNLSMNCCGTHKSLKSLQTRFLGGLTNWIAGPRLPPIRKNNRICCQAFKCMY